MRRTALLLAAVLSTAILTTSQAANSAPPVPRQCFWASQVTSFSDVGPDRALISVGAREHWELTLAPGCPDVDAAMKIGIRSHGGEKICPGRPAELLVPNPGGASFQSCLVHEVRKLSREEAAAERSTS